MTSTRNERTLWVAVWAGLSDRKCVEHLKGLNACERVGAGLLFRRFPVQGLPKFRQVCPPKGLRFSAVLSHGYTLLVTVPWCLRFRPDVCVGISLLPHSVLAKLGQIVSGAKAVNWLIGTDIYRDLSETWWGKRLRRPLANAACTMSMGRGSNQKLTSMGWSPERLVVGRCAYDFPDCRDLPTEKPWDILYLGRLVRRPKRIELLLYAIRELQKSVPGVRCAIAGEGSDRSRLEGIRQQLGLESRVTFLGHREDVHGLLHGSRILVMTSAWEGLPSSIVEAFDCGIPVVASRVGDIADIVMDGENGILVDSDRPSDYAEAIRRILEPPGEYRRMRLAARRKGEQLRHETAGGMAELCWRKALALAVPEDCFSGKKGEDHA